MCRSRTPDSCVIWRLTTDGAILSFPCGVVFCSGRVRTRRDPSVPAQVQCRTIRLSEEVLVEGDFIIPLERFDNPDYITDRLAATPESVRGVLRTALSYLYLSSGPINLPRHRLKLAERHLEPRERVLARWLQTRTNGSLRSTYGARALKAARSERYRCAECGFADVRALHLDHVDGRTVETEIACLCANCHNIKSREHDWSGERRYS